MKKVLIVGFFRPYFPYGSARILGLAKYLQEFGWQPTVLTPLETQPLADDRFRVARTPYSGDVLSFWRNLLKKFVHVEKGESYTQTIKELLNILSKKSIIDRMQIWYQAVFAYPDAERKWRAPALRVARDLLQRERFDAVISVWPVTAHFVAKELKAEFNIPWVADFPDPWSENHDYPFGRVRKYFDRRLEIKTIRGADALAAAAPGFAEKQRQLHRRPVAMISHGFDPDTQNVPPAPLTKKFTVTYTGTIYPDNKQNPEKIMKALSELIAAGLIDRANVELRFFGKRLTWLEGLITRNRLEGVTRQYGRVSPSEAAARQRESQVLLLLGWEESDPVGGFYPFKAFEYLAAGRPILVTGGAPNEDIKTIVQQTSAGVAAQDVPEIKDQLLRWYREYLADGAVSYRGNRREIEKYSYRETARKFAATLDTVSSKNAARA